MLVAAACSAAAERDASCSDRTDGPIEHRYRDGDEGTEGPAGQGDDLHGLDVYGSPTAQDCPILIWVHGGSWQAGDKRTRATAVKADHFIASGHVFVSINYRLAAANNAVRWPDFGHDVAAAIAWVHDNASDIGGDRTDISIIGHSSGAHLATIVATNPDLLAAVGRDRSDLSCVISLDSVTNDLTDEPPWETDIIDLAFPTPALRRDGSPTLQVLDHPIGGARPRFLIVTRGREQRIESANALADAIDLGADVATVVDVSPYDHAEVNVRLGVEGESVITPVVDDFLASC